MFSIGDKVAYPMHGAGLIENIQKNETMSGTAEYYVVRISHGNLQLMIPVRGAENTGLRPVTDKKGLNSVYKVLAAESTPMDDNWNRRNRDNMEKLKSGDLSEVAEVIRNLVRVDRVKKLSTGEKKLLSNAKHILASEMMMVLDIEEADALSKIDKTI